MTMTWCPRCEKDVADPAWCAQCGEHGHTDDDPHGEEPMNAAHDYRTALSVLPDHLGSTDSQGPDRKAVKLFTPDGAASWFLVEFDPGDNLAFGLCDLGMGFPELGYVSLDEITEVRGGLGLPVEVDLYFNGTLADGYRDLGLEVPAWL